MTQPRFVAVEQRGDAAALHTFEPPSAPRPTVVVAEVTRAALVLGSTQPDAVADRDRADRGGYEIVRRRSGGGSVWLAPDAQLWVDVWIPAGDALWVDDVAAAAVPIGEAWRAALRAVGLGVDLTVHHAGVIDRPWSDLVCFAGVGPGEVLDGADRKWVGISQRRTREWIRLQTMVHRSWSPEAVVDGLVLDSATRRRAIDDLREAVGTIADADPIPALLSALG